jgi:fucose 4-O-acetylase-like acetyltransferase
MLHMNATETPTSAPVSPVAPGKPRLEFIDNLRWVMILLVVSMHAAVTYSHLGSWYFMEDPKPDLALTALFATYQVWLQAFFMGLLFFIAGYFVPGALERKGPWKFLSDRTVRLGLPALLYMLMIHPVTVYWLLREFAEPSWPALRQAYWPYLSSGRVLSGSGPMWFTLALLGFSLVYVLIRLPRHAPPCNVTDDPLPNHAQVIGLALVIATCTFLVRTVQPVGTNVFNMQLCFFSQYILLFAVGIRAGQRNWLLRIPFRFGARWLTLALTVGAVAWIGFLVAVLLTKSQDKISGGWTWQSAALSLWESFFCVGMCLGLLVLFRDKFNRQGPLARWFSDNSFAVYMFHSPLLIAVTLALRPFAAPKPLKFLCATVFGSAVTLLASSLVFRRIPGLRRIL